MTAPTLEGPVLDIEPAAKAAKRVSPKVVLAVAAATLAPALLALIGYLQTPDGAVLFSNLPPWLVVTIPALLTGLATGLSAYLKTDPLRKYGADQLAEQQKIAQMRADLEQQLAEAAERNAARRAAAADAVDLGPAGEGELADPGPVNQWGEPEHE